MKVQYQKAVEVTLKNLNGGDCFFLPNEPGNIFMKSEPGNAGYSTSIPCLNISDGYISDFVNGATSVVEVHSKIVIDMKNVWDN